MASNADMLFSSLSVPLSMAFQSRRALSLTFMVTVHSLYLVRVSVGQLVPLTSRTIHTTTSCCGCPTTTGGCRAHGVEGQWHQLTDTDSHQLWRVDGDHEGQA